MNKNRKLSINIDIETTNKLNQQQPTTIKTTKKSPRRKSVDSNFHRNKIDQKLNQLNNFNEEKLIKTKNSVSKIQLDDIKIKPTTFVPTTTVF